MRTHAFSVLLAGLWLVAACGAALAEGKVPDSIPGTTRVSAEEVIGLVEKHDDLVIVDARKRSDFAKGHIDGAVSLPDTETTPESLAAVVPNKDTPVLFYCNGVKCGRSVTSAKLAIKWGYRKVYWFRGGVEEWMEKGYPLVK